MTNFVIVIRESMRRTYLIGLLLMCVMHVWGQARLNGQYLQYINQYKDLAIEQMFKYRIPAKIGRASCRERG